MTSDSPHADKLKTFLRSNIKNFFALALLALVVHDILGAHGFIAMRRTQKNIEQIQKQIGTLNEENKALSEQVYALKTDPNAVERIAREEMGLARPGEIIYKLPEPEKSGHSQPALGR
jgi:cell division protein FtsB